MTDKLQQEAREAAEAIVPNKGYGYNQVRDLVRERGFVEGYVYAATAREKEIEETTAANQHLLESEAGLIEMINQREAEIASLRAKLEAVPVEEIRAVCEWELSLDFPDTAAIDRWLTTVTK